MASTKWQVAAEKLANADFVMVAAGAGFSADSGLPVYNDIADIDAYRNQGLDYQDLCDPYWLDEDAPIFLGFWGNCLNAYRDTKTHRGYELLQKWKTQLLRRTRATRDKIVQTLAALQQKGALPRLDPKHRCLDPFFIYTSNVDAHFLRGFEHNEVYEIHGNIEHWQCAGTSNGLRKPCEQEVWMAPPNFRFSVDANTMRAELPSDSDPESRFLRCRRCRRLARPNILMFCDKNWISNTSREYAYTTWELVMEELLEEDPSLRLVILEIGCGRRVPSVRRETEVVIIDTLNRCDQSQNQTCLIRINPDYPDADDGQLQPIDVADPANGQFLSIKAKALEALEMIDLHMPTPSASAFEENNE